MLCPSWTRRSNSASSCFLSQKSEPPATLVVNGLLTVVLLFIMDSSITSSVLHDTCYTTSLATTVTRASCRIDMGSAAHSRPLPSFPRVLVIPVFSRHFPEHFFPMPRVFLSNTRGASEGCFRRRRESILSFYRMYHPFLLSSVFQRCWPARAAER